MTLHECDAERAPQVVPRVGNARRIIKEYDVTHGEGEWLDSTGYILRYPHAMNWDMAQTAVELHDWRLTLNSSKSSAQTDG